MAQPSHAARFHANLLGLIDDVKAIVSSLEDEKINTGLSPLTFDLARVVVGGWKAEDVIDGFVQRSTPYWEEIRSKNMDFLITHANTIFGDIKMESQVDAIKRLFSLKKTVEGKSVSAVPPKLLESIWETLHGMVRISIRHIHAIRNPQPVVKADGTTVMEYLNPTYGSGISLRKEVERWGVTQ